MSIMRAIVDGERDPMVLANSRDPLCKSDKQQIAKALEGNFRPELVFALQQALETYDFFNAQIISCEKFIEQNLEQWNQDDQDMQPRNSDKNSLDDTLKRRKKNSSYSFDAATKMHENLGVDLTEIPGLEANSVMKIIAEIGTDMTKWPTVKHFASWLGLCPDNKISGGKILSSKTRKTANKAAQVFRLAAFTLSRSKSALGAYFRKMRGRLGGPKAITATAHKLAKIVYSMLRDCKKFNDIGQAEFERLHAEKAIQNLKKRANDAGFILVKKEFVTA